MLKIRRWSYVLPSHFVYWPCNVLLFFRSKWLIKKQCFAVTPFKESDYKRNGSHIFNTIQLLYKVIQILACRWTEQPKLIFPLTPPWSFRQDFDIPFLHLLGLFLIPQYQAFLDQVFLSASPLDFLWLSFVSAKGNSEQSFTAQAIQVSE